MISFFNWAKKKFKIYVFKRLFASSVNVRKNQIFTILDDGHGNLISSVLKKSVNAEQHPIPWFSYPSIEYLTQLDLSSCAILEWGIGNSSLFFARQCKTIDSVEHDQEWFNSITRQLPENAKGYLVNEDDYARFPKTLEKNFDLIVIDGIRRRECIDTAIELLNEGGIIILDNSDRNPEYCEVLRNNDFIEVDFHGFGPIVSFTTTTSFFFHRKANFQPKTVQPKIPIGGGY